MPSAWIVPGAAGAGALLLAVAPAPSPRLLWNTTASAPIGLWILGSPRPVTVGAWLAVRPPPDLARSLAARGVLPSGVLLLKQAAALAPSRVCRLGDQVTIDGSPRARTLAADRQGRPLPQWRGCRPLQAGEVFLLNPAPGSLDSRYFGPLPLSAVMARAAQVVPLAGGRDAF